MEHMTGLIEELKIGNVQDKKPVLDKRLPTKVSYIIRFYCLHRYILQEECDKLVNATVDGDEEVISTLINDGVDMDAVICEVCSQSGCASLSKKFYMCSLSYKLLWPSLSTHHDFISCIYVRVTWSSFLSMRLTPLGFCASHLKHYIHHIFIQLHLKSVSTSSSYTLVLMGGQYVFHTTLIMAVASYFANLLGHKNRNAP